MCQNLESAVNCQPSHRGEALSAEAQLLYASKNSLKTIKNINKKSDFFQKKLNFCKFSNSQNILALSAEVSSL